MNFVSLRPKYFIFIGYLKTGSGVQASPTPEPPRDPPLLVVLFVFVAVFRQIYAIFVPSAHAQKPTTRPL